MERIAVASLHVTVVCPVSCTILPVHTGHPLSGCHPDNLYSGCRYPLYDRMENCENLCVRIPIFLHRLGQTLGLFSSWMPAYSSFHAPRNTKTGGDSIPACSETIVFRSSSWYSMDTKERQRTVLLHRFGALAGRTTLFFMVVCSHGSAPHSGCQAPKTKKESRTDVRPSCCRRYGIEEKRTAWGDCTVTGYHSPEPDAIQTALRSVLCCGRY